jgi:NAD(P) transhydrogenase
MNHFLTQRMEQNNTQVHHGTGVFVDPHRIRIDETGEVLEAGHVLIATGSSPVHPPELPFGAPEVYDSDTILELDKVPGSLGVIGAGVIGAEYACTFAALGTKVHVIDGRDVLLAFLDTEISSALKTAMERNGVVFHWNQRQTAFSNEPDGRIALTLGSGERLVVDAVLVAAGRKSNVEKLNLAAAGVASGDHGQITVDDRYITSVPHIAAVGDVIGFPALASTSMDQARRAVRHMFGPELFPQSACIMPVRGLLPTGVYTIPEASMIGETEDALRRANVDYVAGRASYGATARGRIIGDADGFLKLLFRRSDMKLLGVHAIGEQATELIHIGLMAMLTGSSVGIFDEACFNIPTLGQLYKIAALQAMAM